MAKHLFFGSLSEVLEIESIMAPIPKAIRAIRDLVSALHQRSSRWRRYLDTNKLQITRKRQFCDALTELNDSDGIAVISRPGSI